MDINNELQSVKEYFFTNQVFLLKLNKVLTRAPTGSACKRRYSMTEQISFVVNGTHFNSFSLISKLLVITRIKTAS